MLNLEHIPYTAVSDEGVSYEHWRKSLEPRYAVVWRDMSLGYLSIAILLFALAKAAGLGVAAQLAIGIAGGAAIGFTLAFLSLFLHEAGHYNLHPSRSVNDRLATIFLCALFGLDIRSYRKIHWLHHRHLGTPDDTESSYFNALTTGFLLETLTGIHLLRIMRKRNEGGLLTAGMKKDSFRMLVAGAVVNGLVVAAGFWLGGWAPSIAWVLGMLLFFPFFATLRQVLEHRDEAAAADADFSRDAHGKITRLFADGPLARVFGGAGFQRHLIHHWDPQVSYTRLADVEAFLSRSALTRPIIESARTTYGDAFRKLARR
ncbi:MAG: fatty acid desaturase [Flaviaesturariibacter sp.]|nr:fatty acid desaturase [Flaviaesturariibacter sp.]